MSATTRSTAGMSPTQKRELLAKMLRERAAAGKPLSFAQARLWFLDRFAPGDPTYNIPVALRLPGPLDVAALKRTINEIVRRHEMLRTTFHVVDGSPVQVVSPSLRIELQRVDLRAVPPEARAAEAQRLSARESSSPFDLTRSPLLRATLLKLAADDHVLVVVMHHIVSDGWSMTVFLDELSTLYAAYSSGNPSPLPELELQYSDFAQWQAGWLKGEVLERELSYWRAQLDGLRPLLDLPTDRPRPPVQTRRGAAHPFELEPRVLEGLHAIGREEGATLFMTLLAAVDTLLHRYTGETDIAVGSPIASRTLPELEGLIGFFVNTLVLRADLSGDPTFRQLLRRVRELALDAYAHQDLPFEKLVEELGLERNLDHNPLFQVMFSVQTLTLPAGGGAAAQRDAQPPLLTTSTAKFDLTLAVNEIDGRASGAAEYNTDLFDERTVAGLVDRLQILLRAIVADPDAPVSRLSLLEPAERRDLVDRREDLADRDAMRSITEALGSHAVAKPDAPALICDGASVSYAQLACRTNQLANHLRALGVTPGSTVGISIEPSPDMVVAALAVLAAGGVFVLLDPAEPAPRLAAMLHDAAVAAIVVADERHHAPDGGPAALLSLAGDADAIARASAEPPEVVADVDGVCCLAYRSGPSGTPEAILVTQRGLCRTARALRIGAADRVAPATALSDDATYLLLFGTLAAGGAAVMLHDAGSPRRLATTLRDHAVTVHCASGADIELLAREFPWCLRSLRLILCADGAGAPTRLRDTLGHDVLARVHVTYGTLESGGWCALQPLATGPPHDRGAAPVRDALDGGLLLLDAALEPVPEGVTGEVYVAGDGLALGIHRQPARSAQLFVPDPFSGKPGARLHRTGDRARRHADGAFEHRGRLDARTTRRGERFHLEEIEHVLRQCPGVGDGGVVIRAASESSELELTALVVAADGVTPSDAELSAFVADRLPESMVPRAFRTVAALPYAAAGQLDRRALAELGVAYATSSADPGYVAPRTDSEQRIADIWGQTFGLERLGIHENFFHLGGHSLLATRVVARICDAFEVDLALRQFFEAPTIAELAPIVDELARSDSAPEWPRLARVARDGAIPLSFAQQRLWFLAQLEPGSSFYNMPAPLRLAGPIDVGALREALNDLVARHESLRTTFRMVEEEPVQVIAATLRLDLPFVDLRGLSTSSREAEAQRLTALEAQRPFDLEQGPLIRAQLLELDDTDHLLLLTVHHIVSDGWSMKVLFRDLTALYDAHRLHTAPALAPLALSYADFSTWQRQALAGPVLERHLTYWRRQLEGAPPILELPTDRPRPAVQVFRGGDHMFALPAVLADRVKELSEREGLTLFMTLLAGFKVLLHRYTGQRDLVVGTPIANRTRPELEGLIGFFANTLVLRTDVAGEQTFRQLMARVRQVTLDAYAHQDLPFEKLVEELEPQRSLGHNPLFQVMFALQNTGRVLPSGITATGDEGAIGTGIAKFDLTAFLAETTDGIDVGFEYNTDLFDASTIARMATHFESLLTAATADPDRPIDSLPMLSEAEILQLSDWSRSRGAIPEQTVHALFEAQAARTPDAVALRFGATTMSYRELNAWATGVGRRLLELGAAADAPVGLCAARSPEMVVGALAALKAGCAYLPLDPSYPARRLAAMIADAEPGVVLTQRRLASRLPATHAEVVLLDPDDASPDVEPGEPLVATSSPDGLAYVLYTSGSTGRPKGVAMAHRPLVNLLGWQIARSALGAGSTTLQFAPLSFDVSFQEIFSTLCAGGTLLLTDDETRRDPDALLDLLAAERVDRVFLPFVALQQLADRAADRKELPGCLREVVTAGEQLQITPQIRALFTRLRCRLYNQYGPTETHVVTEHELTGPAAHWPSLPPIGRPLPNASVRLLDRAGQVVPVGVPGEVYLGGLMQARGYIRQPRATAERFGPDLDGEPGERLYRTGDRARHLLDGAIEFLGRVDDQLKVRGFRVEPGEVEATLREHPAVRQAAVVARQDGADGLRLAAYVQPHAAKAPTAPQLREHLATSLPEHMVPAIFVVLDNLPLTPSGKLDRRRLPALADAAGSRGEGVVAPRTPTEQALVCIWSDLLGVQDVSIHDNFFELGGHSLLATRVVSRIRHELRCEIPLRRLFASPTIEQLAIAILDASVEGEQAEKVNRLLLELDEMSEKEAQALLRQ